MTDLEGIKNEDGIVEIKIESEEIGVETKTETAETQKERDQVKLRLVINYEGKNRNIKLMMIYKGHQKRIKTSLPSQNCQNKNKIPTTLMSSSQVNKNRNKRLLKIKMNGKQCLTDENGNFILQMILLSLNYF